MSNHIHSLVIDGVYAADDDDKPQFQVLPAPDDEEIAQVTETLAVRIRKFFQQRGLGPDSDPEESDPLVRDQPWLAGVYAASVRGRVADGANSGRRVTHRGDQIDPESMNIFASPRCVTVDGFSLHGNVSVSAGDRLRLERLARYAPGLQLRWNVCNSWPTVGYSIVSSVRGVTAQRILF